MDEVRRLRKLKGLTQVELAERAGVSAYTITEIETGHREPRPSTLRKLADALDADVADFFPKAEAPSTSPNEATEAGLDAEDLTNLYGELDADLRRVRETPAEEVKEERVAELLSLRDELQTAIVRAINGKSWGLTELSARDLLRERRRKAQRARKDAESEVG